jgi:hypothetical protein
MSVILVAERFNAPRVPRWDEMPVERWIRLSLRLGAFRKGLGASRLLSLGLSWDRALNLLPPSPICGEWDAERARDVAVTLLGQLQDEDELLMVGRKVTEAFDVAIPFGESVGGFTAVPHPSGRNRWWNEVESVHNFRRKLCRST